MTNTDRFFVLFTLLFTLLLSACKTNNSVVSDGLFQIRKHRPGFHLNLGREQRFAVQPVRSVSEQQPLRSAELISEEIKSSASERRLSSIARKTSQRSIESMETTIIKHRSSSLLPHTSFHSMAHVRTEELEEIDVAMERNRKNLIATSLLSMSSLLLFILATIGFLIIGPIAAILGGLAIILFLFTFPLIFIYLIERGHLKRGELYFNASRIERWSGFTHVAQRLQIISFIGLLTAFMLLLFAIGASTLFLTLLVFASIGLGGVFFLSTWLGFISGVAVRNYSEKAKESLGKILITWLAITLISIGIEIAASALI